MAVSSSVASRKTVWRNLLARLDQWDADWRSSNGMQSPTQPRRAEKAGPPISNREAFEAFAVALLSGNTRWDRIERVRNELIEPFEGYDPKRFSTLTDDHIERAVMPWFRQRKAGAAGLRSGLLRLRETARLLAGGGHHPSAQAFLKAAFAEANGSPEAVAVLLGSARDWKLPGFGIALAAEALRMLGYDLCKPDRHVLRAIGSWNFVCFARWDRKGAFTAPQARPKELLATMLEVRRMAEANALPVSYTNSIIWTAGAVSGARLTNEEFSLLRDDRAGA